MASERAIYWFAVGVVALGLNSRHQQREACWVHKLADRSIQAAECVTARGLSLLSMAEVMLGKNPGEIDRLQAALGRLEARQSQAVLDDQPKLAQAQRDLEQLNIQMNDVKIAVPKVRCPRAKIAAELSNQFVDVNVPEMVDGTMVVNGTQIDLRELQSLQPLQSLPSLESLRSLRDFRAIAPQVPRGRVQVKIYKMKTDGGPI